MTSTFFHPVFSGLWTPPGYSGCVPEKVHTAQDTSLRSYYFCFHEGVVTSFPVRAFVTCYSLEKITYGVCVLPLFRLTGTTPPVCRP